MEPEPIARSRRNGISRRQAVLTGISCLASAALGAPASKTSTVCWAGERWYDERTVGPIAVHADYGLADHEAFLDGFGQLQDDLVRTLDIPTARESVHVFLFARKATYLAYLQTYFPRVPYRRALFIKERGPGMVLAYRSPELEVDLRHETTHALLNAVMADVPLWLDEGLAEYFEVPAADRARNTAYVSTLKWQTWIGQLPRLEDLEALDDLSRMGRNEYRHSWAWVHFLLHGPSEARSDLVRYLADLRQRASGPKLSDTLRRRWPDLDQQFAQHFRSWKS